MDMKKVTMAFFIILFLCYIGAVTGKSIFLGDLLSPLIALGLCGITFFNYYSKAKDRSSRSIGFLLSLGMLFWGLADILWALDELLLHREPGEDMVITSLYLLTNLFLTAALIIYGYRVFHKWNILQMLLDTFVVAFFVFELIWITFLQKNAQSIDLLEYDWISGISILFDVLIATGIVIWYIYTCNEKLALYLYLEAFGILLFVCNDLAYYYNELYIYHGPAYFLDVIYLLSFAVIALAAALRPKSVQPDTQPVVHNTGQKRKGYILLIAPLLLILFQGFDAILLLLFVSVILLYYILSGYLQNNISKEDILLRERKHISELEQKVKERTEELEEKNRVLLHLLDQDFVTGLKNRRFLLSYLEKMIASLKEGETIVLLYIDINRFKMISTMYGHYIGDMILYEMAERLIPMEKLAENTILTSYRDDTFVFAAVGEYDYGKGYEFAKEAVKLCSDLYKIEDYQIKVTVNIGISVFTKDSTTKEELIKHADIAMSQAKTRGFNYVQEFDADLSKAIFRRNTIEIMLKKVNFNQEFMVYYQPQFRTENRKLIGFEALLRWKTPAGEMIGPGEFIPVAEETSYIIPIGDWVTTMALKQLVLWNRRFKEKIMIGINVSLKQLNSPRFIKGLKEEIKHLEINPKWIDLEITESLQFHENPEILFMLEDIHNFGVNISIDDFGTGYSSLSYFKNLPIDRIKLAKELIDNIHTDDFDYKLAEAIILLAKAKGIRVIAEGVELKEQWNTLKKLQCDEVQGFYFGRPEPVSTIEAMYRAEM